MQSPALDLYEMHEDLERDRAFPGDQFLDPREKLPIRDVSKTRGSRARVGVREVSAGGPTGLRRASRGARDTGGTGEVDVRHDEPPFSRTAPPAHTGQNDPNQTAREDRCCLNYSTPDKEPRRARDRGVKYKGERKSQGMFLEAARRGYERARGVRERGYRIRTPQTSHAVKDKIENS
jgi:hypothetical protein